ncbi:MBOAT, membrane-bound O-acyltransferase family-domain-containing protein [Radiomyces spectabilis]|uniref:MBOAT, membrane-bound O-acyltransferase family-domain-containing protein n=1 Tax=Radiomyces spectabilis TaxID=64574 RepID=UPI00221E4282|nr:MBOAT, membrane-bound O-acyltransferase family-domain-containing protein [Radiomyces spectabilis]KAI8377970.1 MBOAT, membrane-bound O-acyltransferase family-domain-containing protein [Radiomyces spectabilis]
MTDEIRLQLIGQPNAEDADKHKELRSTSASRWRTKEFYFYYACVAVVVPYMIYVTYGLGPNSPYYNRYAYYLSEGWIAGRKVDNSDLQYATFRNNLPKLILLAVAFLFLSHAFRMVAQKRPTDRFYFLAMVSVLITLGLHGASIIKILIIVSCSYGIAFIAQGSRWNPICTWIFNLAILFGNEYYNGYRFATLGSTFAWLDQYQGYHARWHVLFNFVMLRLISFNVDYYWQCRKGREAYTVARSDESITDKERITIPCRASDYNYVYFISYVFYTPLYLCGPIITFNDFVSQVRQPSSKIQRSYVVIYALRWMAVVLVMEVTLHYLYVVAISKAGAWEGYTPMQLSMIGYFNLVIIWMKLLIPWRFFRLWALLDGIWPEENMVRCVSNNYSAQRFWKSWHRSFNRWMIRYIFIPLGGSKYITYNMWIVFTFVALWHDLELKLLAWGWLICLFLLPEIIASKLYNYDKYGEQPSYRFVCGLGATFNILLMMIANLVGFCIGLDGMKAMLSEIMGNLQGFYFLLCAIAALFVGVQIMFEIRESEKRRGDPKWTM